MDHLIVLNGRLDGVRVQVLKDDGCNTNIVSKRRVMKFRHCFKIIDEDVTVQHSDQNATERSSHVIFNGALKIGEHTYTYNWVVANSRNDVLLGMLWHVAHRPVVNFKDGTVKVGDLSLNCAKTERLEDPPPLNVTILSVRKFRRLLLKGKGELEVLQLVRKNNVNGFSQLDKCDTKLDNVLKKYEAVFREDLPDGLPPESHVDHEITIENDEKHPHTPLFQLSPEVSKAAKEYVDTCIKKKKITPSRSPYGAQLFFVKEKNNLLRGVVNYSALNRITKKNSTPLRRSDEMLYRLGVAKMFSKMDLNIGFHQIRMRPGDVEKTAFNTKYG